MADDTTRIINLTEATEVSDGMYLVTDASTGTRKLSLQKVLDKSGGNVADEYDSTATYDVGDLVVYKGVLYECSSAITTAEAWNPAHWTQKTINSKINETDAFLEKYASIELINILTSGYIATNVGVGNTVTLTPVSNSAFVNAVVDVVEGTKLTLNGTGWTTGRLWCFIDSEDKVISASGNTVTAENLVLTAPANAVKCIINMYKDTVGVNYKGVKAVKTDKTLTVDGDAADSKIVGDKFSTVHHFLYTDMVQGAVDKTTGLISNVGYAVSTKKLPVEAFKRLKKLQGYRVETHKYDSSGQYLGHGDYVQTVVSEVADLSSVIKTSTPATAYVILTFIYYVNGSIAPLTPSDYNATDNELFIDKSVLWDNAFVIAEGINNIVLENVTLDSSLYFTLKNGRNFYKNIIVSVDATANLAGSTPCTIYASRRWLNPTGESINQYYGSPKYIIGGNGERKQTQFRLPCGVYGMSDYVFDLIVPADSSVTIHSLSFDFDDSICRDSAIQLNAHGLCGYGGPPDTELSYIMSAKLGYKYCITIPKVTNDGEYVCFHDDSNITDRLRNPDGTELDSEYQNKPISDFDYEDLLAFDAGVRRGQIFRGEKVPLLSTFFKVCAETGMHPMLSVHPDLDGHWNNIKALAEKYNVLHILNIKAPAGTTLTAPMSVLGNDVESYTVDINSAIDAVDYMDGLKTTYNLDDTKVKLGIEYFLAYATDANISAALEAGYFVAVANVTSETYNTYTSFIEKGVTQFTDDYMPCVGLKWY